jgi:hypothetical protein
VSILLLFLCTDGVLHPFTLSSSVSCITYILLLLVP